MPRFHVKAYGLEDDAEWDGGTFPGRGATKWNKASAYAHCPMHLYPGTPTLLSVPHLLADLADMLGLVVARKADCHQIFAAKIVFVGVIPWSAISPGRSDVVNFKPVTLLPAPFTVSICKPANDFRDPFPVSGVLCEVNLSHDFASRAGPAGVG